MMKQKVLFIVGTLQSGGVSKSLVNLLNSWDYHQYNTSVLLCSKKGDVFSKSIPKDIKIIYNPIIESAMGGLDTLPKIFQISEAGLCCKIKLFCGVLIRLVLSRFSKSKAGLLISKMMPVLSCENYDLAVDYGGQQLLYYMVDKVNAKKKISFFHSDYAKWDYYYKADKKYYSNVDQIFTVSDSCVASLRKYFPNYSEKIALMENVSSPSFIYWQAKSRTDSDLYLLNDAHNNEKQIFLTLGHVWFNKGIDLAIEAATLLKKRNFQFVWFFIGAIREKKWLDIIEERGLTHQMIFLGIKENPYPFIQLADIYIHPSRFEGKSIALDEAKILCKPIVVTDFSTVNDQFENRVNASICKMNKDDLADKIEELINRPELRERYHDYLAKNVIDNHDEINKIYHFLEK